MEFIGVPSAFAIDKKDFVFNSADFNELIERQFSDMFVNCAAYIAAYGVDMVVFSGKTSELPHFRQMAERLLPINTSRLVFAKSFKPGDWYPFIDRKGFIKDAKTVTVVGAALYYALAQGAISGWRISSIPNQSAERNEWGEIETMRQRGQVFMNTADEKVTVWLMPNSIIARRRNMRCAPEAVYRFVVSAAPEHRPYEVQLARKSPAEADTLELQLVDGQPPTGCELRLCPLNGDNLEFWQETGIFDL